jgi:hypothetical protein
MILCKMKNKKDYLCKLMDNVYNIDFVRFKIRDIDRDQTLFEISKPVDPSKPVCEPVYTENDTDDVRFIRYRFSKAFLKLKTIGAT